MNGDERENYILENYSSEIDFPWAKFPNYEVFRHKDNREWFALMMDVSKNKLELEGKESIDVINLMCVPILIDSLRNEDGFFPAYHMNKEHWITVSLDDVCDEKIKMLLDISFELTLSK